MEVLRYNFPAQKKTLAQKTEQWGIDCIEAGIAITENDPSKIRKSKREKQINYDLVNGIIDESDINNAFNPMGIRGINFPAKTQNYPIEISKLNVLKGEEARRRFDWKLRSVNEDVISQKEFLMGQQMQDLIFEEVMNAEYAPEMAEKRIKQLQHYQQYEFQDMGELMGTRIMDYHWYTKRLKDLFSDAFYDVLISAEEIYAADIEHGEPKLFKKHPVHISTLGGNSNYIEDSDVIVDDGYDPIGKVIDDFWDVLTPNEIDKLETGSNESRYNGNRTLRGPVDPSQESREMSNSQLIVVDGSDSWAHGGSYDENGNIRVTRTVWRSRRKLGELSYPDPSGNIQTTLVDENFPIERFEDLGWTIEWFWINEWYQGYRIGGPDGMYKKIEPLPRIGSNMTNPSICLPPYVGTVYSIGKGKSVSLMDRIKPYKYLYNVYMKRTELASARNKGVIAELDLAEIPDGWDEELVMMYAEANGYKITDSFNTGKKGVAQGKMIGSIKQRNSNVMNLNSSDIIRANLELARYVKVELGEIAGITPQREGQIDNRETLGGVERSVTQSSHITEEWFRVHDNTKIRAMMLLLETSKYAWKNNPSKKLQYVDDGLISHIFSIDGREFSEAEYGYYISDGQNDAELIQAIRQLSQAALQNDKASFKDIFTIYRDTSVSSMIRKLENSEKQSQEREDSIRQEQMQSQERIQQSMERIEMMRSEQQYAMEDRKIEADITKAEMQLEAKMAQIEAEDKSGVDREKIRADIQKQRLELQERRKERQEKAKQFYDQLKAEKEQLNMKLQNDLKIASKRKPAKV